VPGDTSDYASERDVYATRLDSSGDPIETTPIVLSDDVADQYGVRACWNGTNWLVTWTSRAPYPNNGDYISGVVAVRISPAGEILDDPFLVYPNPSGTVEYLCTASDGVDWIVFLNEEIFNGFDTDFYLKGARVSPAGNTLGSPETLFAPSCCYFFPLGTEAAYADGQYMVVFECIPSVYVNDAICAMRFTQSLDNIDDYPFEVAGTSGIFRLPTIATDGTDFLVGWYYYSGDTYPPTLVTPYCARVTAAGVSLDPSGINLAGMTGSGDFRRPQVAWDGMNWIAAWSDDQGGRAARITPDGTVLDPGGLALPGYGASDIVAEPGGVRVIWSDDDAGGVQPEDVHTAHISSGLVAGPETTVSIGAPSHVRADAASGSTETMLVFRSDVSGAHRIMLQTAADYAAPDKADPTTLASGPMLDDPEIAWNGTVYLVVWSDEQSGKIAGTRVMPDGTMLDDPAITVMDGLDPDVAAVGDDFLVVATDEVSPGVSRPHGARVRGSDGAVLDGTPILLGVSYAEGARVAGMATRWLVTWERHPAFDDENADIWAAFVDTDGTSPGEFGVATNQATSERHYSPAVGSSESTALIVWEDTRTYPDDDWNLYARRVRVDGMLFDDPDGFDIAVGALDQRNAAVAWNGTVYQVVYEQTEQLGYFDHSLADVYGTRVDPYGVIVEPPEFAVEATAESEVVPAVTGRDSESLAVISAFMTDSPYASYRLVLQELGDGTTGVSDGDTDSQALLAGAFPNPSRGATTIRLALPRATDVSLSIYDVSGRLVRKLLEGPMPAGERDVGWDGRDDSGREVAAGLYLVRVEADDLTETGKLALLR
jgi:hypothetical protein